MIGIGKTFERREATLACAGTQARDKGSRSSIKSIAGERDRAAYRRQTGSNRAENRETSLIKSRKESLFKRRSGSKGSEVLFLGGRRVCIISEQISAHRQ